MISIIKIPPKDAAKINGYQYDCHRIELVEDADGNSIVGPEVLKDPVFAHLFAGVVAADPKNTSEVAALEAAWQAAKDKTKKDVGVIAELIAFNPKPSQDFDGDIKPVGDGENVKKR